MNMAKIMQLAVVCLGLASCDAPVDTIAGRVQDAVLKACDFRASYSWLVEIVTKADVTVGAVDALVLQICAGVQGAREGLDGAQSLKSGKDCLNGSIVVAGEEVCIEGEDAPATEKE